MNNLTRYHIGDKVIIGKQNDFPPRLALGGEIVGEAPHMREVFFPDNHYFGKAQRRWLHENDFYVISRVVKQKDEDAN